MDKSEYFIAGGTLPFDTKSYVIRPADEALYEHVLGQEFCFVLTARQMGKSSLMIRTVQRLKDNGVSGVIIDLTRIGTVPIDKWYLGLLTRIQRELKLSTNAQMWWQQHTGISQSQRFVLFLRDIVLKEIAGQVAIFIDEIDSTLKLDFRDDFFAAIRAMYNARASDPVYKRLTFVLLGVATPTDLIKDRKRTPFNIGQAIILQEFSRSDAQPLLYGLELQYGEQADSIFNHVFHWTSGHPYLTQKLCLAISQISPSGGCC